MDVQWKDGVTEVKGRRVTQQATGLFRVETLHPETQQPQKVIGTYPDVHTALVVAEHYYD